MLQETVPAVSANNLRIHCPCIGRHTPICILLNDCFLSVGSFWQLQR